DTDDSAADIRDEAFTGSAQTSGINPGQIISPEAMKGIEQQGSKENSEMQKRPCAGRGEEIQKRKNDQGGEEEQKRATALRDYVDDEQSKENTPGGAPQFLKNLHAASDLLDLAQRE